MNRPLRRHSRSPIPRAERFVSYPYTLCILRFMPVQLLQEFGLDFRYLLDDLLAQHLKTPSISALPGVPALRLAVSPPSLSRTSGSSSSPTPSPSAATRPSTPTSRLPRPSLSKGDLSIPSTPIRSPLPRSVDSARAAAPPPPRSTNRPSGSAARPVPVAVPEREGMI